MEENIKTNTYLRITELDVLRGVAVLFINYNWSYKFHFEH